MAKKQKPQVEEVEMETFFEKDVVKKEGIIIICDSHKAHVIVATVDGNNVPVQKSELVGQNLKIGEVVYF